MKDLMKDLMKERRSAGFWVRCGAGLVDLLILAVPLAVFVSFTSVALGVSNQFLDLNPGMPPYEVLQRLGPRLVLASLVFFVAMSWMYFAIFESSRWRATPGKRLLGIYVVDEGGRPVSFWRASRRYAGCCTCRTWRSIIFWWIADAWVYCRRSVRCVIFWRVLGSARGRVRGDRAGAS
jgi:uncharacterized RDD family membrane protein YckC